MGKKRTKLICYLSSAGNRIFKTQSLRI
uniref:Uncharacterized protein n=1 Tax=Arundo donax TaxID=35708 RepID=A0A0A9GVB3_ARUDO